MPGPPPLVGLHHVRLPVSDIAASRDWLVETFGYRSVLETEDEEGVTSAVLEHPTGGSLSVHRVPDAAAAVSGFALVVLSVAGWPGLADWVQWLDAAAVPHGPVTERHSGLGVEVTGPGGLTVMLHTGEHPASDDP